MPETFKKACAAIIHDDDASESLYNIEKGKKSKKKVLSYLYENYIISQRAKYISHSCAKCVELIYGSENSKLIVPLSFHENLLVYSCFQKQAVINLQFKSGTSWKHWYYIKLAYRPSKHTSWVSKRFSENCFWQWAGYWETHRIKSDNKVPSSIVTSHLYICMDPESTIQKDT